MTSLLSLYRSMLRIRLTEESLAERYAEQEMRCPMHLCIGQEAISAGVCAALGNDDVVYSNHRAHGHYLAKGGDLNAMVSEIYGRSTGCCGGRGGSMHLIDRKVGFMGATPIVGGTIPLAVGAAWAIDLRDQKMVSTVFFGDGCFEEGVMHEALNFASLHHLPILFVCENNGFSVYTRLEDRQPKRPIHVVAQAHGCNTWHSDGNDVEVVNTIAVEATARARAGEGAQFLEFDTYRWREHCGPNFDDELNYRNEREITAGKAGDPLSRSHSKLLQEGHASVEELEQMSREIKTEIESAFDFALASPEPVADAEVEKVYAV